MDILRSVDVERMRALRERGEFFWLDLTDPNGDELATVSSLFDVHALAIEDSHEFGQRAKIDEYEHGSLLVFFGAEPGEHGHPALVEVHLHLSEQALITVRRVRLTAVDDAARHLSENPPAHLGEAVHAVLDALTDSLLTALEGYDDDIDELHDAVALQPTPATRRRIFALRRQLSRLRQVVVPQRDLLAPGGTVLDAVPALRGKGSAVSIRDVHDHLDQATRLLGSYREQLASLLDLYLAEVSTRLNEFMRRLSVIATVFLPLSFFVGFFGMNFGWMQDKITPAWTFFVFGIGLLVASGAVVAWYLRRTGAR
ncbi:magnesium transporter CorA family protein [Saccharopolyspora gregorii]|uniref:magnesium transporter CorA family protein n=1 Tax=Saccharopolyspora gregorii TaxID=33914 RepID=UPI0021ABE495|nr:magnesium transporter CorA family protein [Saccharopolyspora gregorii]